MDRIHDVEIDTVLETKEDKKTIKFRPLIYIPLIASFRKSKYFQKISALIIIYILGIVFIPYLREYNIMSLIGICCVVFLSLSELTTLDRGIMYILLQTFEWVYLTFNILIYIVTLSVTAYHNPYPLNDVVTILVIFFANMFVISLDASRISWKIKLFYIALLLANGITLYSRELFFKNGESVSVSFCILNSCFDTLTLQMKTSIYLFSFSVKYLVQTIVDRHILLIIKSDISIGFVQKEDVPSLIIGPHRRIDSVSLHVPTAPLSRQLSITIPPITKTPPPPFERSASAPKIQLQPASALPQPRTPLYRSNTMATISLPTSSTSSPSGSPFPLKHHRRRTSIGNIIPSLSAPPSPSTIV